jgi:phospholipase C
MSPAWSPRSRDGPLFAGIAIALVIATAVPATLVPPADRSSVPIARSPIQHVVEIMMENHAFDNFFGTFPGVIGFPENVSLPNGAGGFVSPYWISGDSTPDLPHDRASEIADLDGGRMDGFVEEMAKFNSSAPDTPMGYYNATQIGGYWALAREFVLCDMYFQPVIGPSIPNRLYAIAGGSGGITSDTWPSGGVELYTIFDELSAYGLSWKYYYLPGEGPPIPLYVSPLRYTPSEVANVELETSLPGAIAAGDLPAVTFVDPEGSSTLSEHPPQNVTAGEAWSLDLIDSIEASPLWNSTVIFLTWDESGGFYDSVVPPVLDGLGDGFRVPMLVISPYTEHGGIRSESFDHTSVLKFIDQNWGLPYLNARVEEANSLGSVLDDDSPS